MGIYDRIREGVEDNRDTLTSAVVGSFVGGTVECLVKATPIIGPVIPSGWGCPLGGMLGAAIGMSNDAERKRFRTLRRDLADVASVGRRGR